METRRKRRLEGAAVEQVPNVVIKQETEWLAEDSHTPDLANQQVELDMEPLRSIKTEEDSYRTAEAARAVQDFTPLPQTDEFIKAELILDEEFRDTMSESEDNCKQLALAVDQQTKVTKIDNEVCGSTFTQKANLKIHTRTKHLEKTKSIVPFECEFCSRTFKKKAHFRTHLSTHATNRKREFTCDICERGFYSKGEMTRHKKLYAQKGHPTFKCEVCRSSCASLENLKIHMLKKHLDKLQSNISGPRTADNDSIDNQMEEFLEEKTASYVHASEEDTARHSEIKSNVKSEACEVCHCIYPTEYIRLHMSLVHSKPNHKCELCSRTFKWTSDFQKHLRTHASIRKREFVCDICERVFCNKGNLESHQKRYAQKDHPKFNCQVCESSFTKKGDLDEHTLTNHLEKSQPFAPALQTAEDGKGKFPCDLCEKKFCNKFVLKRHKKIHTTLNRPNFICEVCGSSFTSRRNLKIHMLRKHLTKEQLNNPVPRTADDPTNTHTEGSFGEEAASLGQESAQAGISKSKTQSEACEVCHCIFPTDYIRIHMSLAHSKPKHECELCSRTFKWKSDLQRHLNTHASNRKREFVCDICERAFYEKYTLDRHQKRYAQKDHPKFDCDVCGSTFKRKGQLDLHLSTKHLDRSRPITPALQTCKDGKREFPCDFCEKKFSSKSILTRHEKIHTTLNRSNFICEVCGSSFRRKSDLKIHMLMKYLDRVQSKTSGLETADDDSIDSHTEEFLDTEAASHGQASQDSATLLSKSETDTKSEACEVCHCIFPTEYIRIHMRLAHKKVQTDDTYDCKVCGKRFKQKESLKVHMLRRQHFDETQQFTPQSSNDADVPMKTELISDEEEEFIDESNDRDSICHAEERQQPALSADDESLRYHMLHKHTGKTKQFTPHPPTKEELISDEEFLGEAT